MSSAYLRLLIFLLETLIPVFASSSPAFLSSWVGKICWRRRRLPTPVFLGFPCGSAGKESACCAGDLGSIPGLRRSPGEEKGYPLQFSGLENSMDCIVHGVTKSRTRLSDFHFHFHPDGPRRGLGGWLQLNGAVGLCHTTWVTVPSPF